MITKKIKQDVFAWEPSAFGGKGYWFVLGKKGGLGRAASKQEAGMLGKPKDSEVNPASPKVLETKSAKKPKKQNVVINDDMQEEDAGEVDTTKGKMSYGEAARIRRRGLFSTIMEKKFEEGKGFGTSIRESISEKSRATAKGFKEKLDPLNLVKGLTGSGAIGRSIRTVAGRAMGRSDEDIGYFGGYERNKKSKKDGTAELISSGIPKPPGATATEDDSAASIVMKIYDLLKQQYDEKKTANQLANAEKGSGKIGGTFVPTKTAKGTPSAKKEKDGGSPIDIVTSMFGLGRTALSVLSTLGPLLVSPMAVALLGAAAVGGIGYFLYKVLTDESGYDKDPNSPLNRGLKQAQEVGGLAGVKDAMDKRKSLPEYDRTMAEIKDYEKDYNEGEKLNNTQLDGFAKRGPGALEAVEDYKVERDKASGKTSSATGSTTSVPSGSSESAGAGGGGGGGGAAASPSDSGASSPTASPSTEPTASPMPAASTSGDQVEMATRQNTEAQMDAQSTAAKPIMMNTTNSAAVPGKDSSTSVGSQPVRDDETSVRRVKIGSVRMV